MATTSHQRHGYSFLMAPGPAKAAWIVATCFIVHPCQMTLVNFWLKFVLGLGNRRRSRCSNKMLISTLLVCFPVEIFPFRFQGMRLYKASHNVARQVQLKNIEDPKTHKLNPKIINTWPKLNVEKQSREPEQTSNNLSSGRDQRLVEKRFNCWWNLSTQRES